MGRFSEQDIMVSCSYAGMTQNPCGYIDGPLGVRTFVVQHLPWVVRGKSKSLVFIGSPTLFDKEMELFERVCH
jgi:hypothetical protein